MTRNGELRANNLLFGTETAQTEEKLPIQSIPIQVAMSNLISKRNWEMVEHRALQLRSRVFSALNLLENEYQFLVEQEIKDKEMCERLIMRGDEMLAALSDESFKKKLKDSGLLKQYRAAAKGMRSHCGKHKDRFSTFRHTSLRSQYVVAIGYTAFWAGFHADFNKFLEKFVPKTPTSSEIKEMAKVIQQEQSIISKNLRKLYSVTGKGNRDDMSSTALDILRSQQANLQSLSTLCASVCGITRFVLKGDLNDVTKKMARIDNLAGKLARSWIFLAVFALYVSFLAILPTEGSTFKKITNTVRRLPFTSKNKKFQVVSPKELWTHRQKYKGKYVQVNGFVRNSTKTRTKSGMFLTVFEVYQPNSENFVRAVVIFEEMGRRGLVDTASVQLYGTWRQTTKNANSFVLRLERLKTFELKNRFGFNYILDRVRPWFDYFPNSYHGYWSVRPHKKAESGVEKALTGAGELVFIKPFSSVTGGR